MPVRANQHQANDVLPTVGDDDGTTRDTTLPADVATNARDPFEFFAALMVGGYDWFSFTPDDGGPVQTWLTQPNGSWVCHITDENGKHTVRQDGPARLWDRIETAHDVAGPPGRPEPLGPARTGHHRTLSSQDISAGWFLGRWNVCEEFSVRHVNQRGQVYTPVTEAFDAVLTAPTATLNPNMSSGWVHEVRA